MTAGAAWRKTARQLSWAAAGLLLGLLPTRGAAADRPLRVVTLSPILTEMAREVGGAEVAVTGLLPPGVDPHTFEPAPGDMLVLTDADLILASGLGLENYLGKLAANSGTRARIAAVGDALLDPPAPISAHGRQENVPSRRNWKSWWGRLRICPVHRR